MIKCLIKHSAKIFRILYFKLAFLVSISIATTNNNNIDYLSTSYPITNYSTQPILNSFPNNNDTTTNTQSQSQQEFYKQLGKLINITISPILLTLGGIGNPLCIIILTRKQKKNPTVVYLCFLAAFDFLVLYTGLFRLFLKDAFDIDIRSLSSFNCKIHMFLTYTFMQISSYILVSVTVNRFTIMFNRTIFCKQRSMSRIKESDSVKSVFWIFTIITVIVSIFNMHFLIFYDTVTSTKKNSITVDCTINKTLNNNYYTFRTKLYSKLHLYLAIVTPFCILFVLNLLIIRKIMVSTKNSSALKQQHNKQQNKANGPGNKKSEKRTALSIMLVSVCLWFMILKTPASVYLTFPATEVQKVYFPLVYSILMLVNYTNHAVNLILYIATSSIFRNDFKEFFMNTKQFILFKCFKRNQSSNENNNNNNKNGSTSTINKTVLVPVKIDKTSTHENDRLTVKVKTEDEDDEDSFTEL